MDDPLNMAENLMDENRSLKRTNRILFVVILILLCLSIILGYFLFICMDHCGFPIPITGPSPSETTVPYETPTGLKTLPPQLTKTPTMTSTTTSTVTPTSTRTPTPDFNATATAACSDFRRQFPGTPCP